MKLKVPVGCAAVAALLGFVAASGCFSRVARVTPTPAQLAARTAVAPGSGWPTYAPVAERPPAPPSGPVFDPASAAFLLEDPQLAEVRKAYVVADYAEAARRMEQIATPTSAEDASRWAYQTGRLFLMGGDSGSATRAFQKAANERWALAPYAAYSAAQLLVRAGQLDQGLALALSVPPELPISANARLLVGEVLEVKRDYDAAVETYQAYLAQSRHPARWVEISLRCAEALLSMPPQQDRAELAAGLARRVLVEAPGAWFDRAMGIERRASAMIPESARMRPLTPHGKRGTMLPTDWTAALSPAEQLARATALSEGRDAKEARKTLDTLFGVLRQRHDSAEVVCRAQMLSAQLYGKAKDRVKEASEYEKAIAACGAHPDALVDALFAGGKASSAASQREEAIARFDRLEREFHSHRLADDARLRGANCVLAQGDETRYEQMLAAMADDYPAGDMVAEGLFQLALRFMQQQRWSAALDVLARAEARDRRDPPLGRSTYFRARALAAMGDVQAAKAGYVAVIENHPLSYYMLHAYARLAELDRAAAKDAVAHAMAREPNESFAIPDHEPLHEGAFVRGVELLRQGENDPGRREFASLMKDEPPAEVVWAVASMYARLGLVKESHSLVKFRATDWLSHYPVGRWRDAWQMAYPRPFSRVVDREAADSKIPAALGYAIMREESAFDPEAVSPAHAYGLMQIITPTAKRLAKDAGLVFRQSDLTTPETNIKLGCRFLGELRSRFSSNPHLAISAYNAGPGAPQRWLANRTSNDFDIWVEQIPFEETRRYTKRVLTSFAAYSFLYEEGGSPDSLALPKDVAPPMVAPTPLEKAAAENVVGL